VRIHPAFQIENLLPHDIIYQLTDQTTEQDNRSKLERGKIDTLYTVNPIHLLVLQIKILGTSFQESDVAVITNSDLGYRDEDITINDADNRPLRLRLKYSSNLEMGCRRVTIYSPYVILNKTGLDMIFSAKSILTSSRIAAGQAAGTDNDPLMFSYSSFEGARSRAQIKVPDSDWSLPLSFEAVGHSFDAVLNTNGREIHVGIGVREGVGKVLESW
jgi:vacuolar protein sorting-associated protein 13A/C